MYAQNVAEHPCPLNEILDLIAAKWTVEILREVSIRPTRTRKFLVHIPGLSMKSLRQRLVALEHAGILLRTEFDEKPRRVEYSLTSKGERLLKILTELKKFAEEEQSSGCVCSIENPLGCTDDFSCPHRREGSKGRNRTQVTLTPPSS